MKYSLLLLLVMVAACSQPTTAPFESSDIRFNESASFTAYGTLSGSLNGIVTWTNKNGNAGKITTADGTVFTYNVRAGHTLNGFVPRLGEAVTFNTGTGASARAVRPYEAPDDEDDDSGDDGEDGDDEDDDDNPPPPPPPLW